jgi:hypothetical protein
MDFTNVAREIGGLLKNIVTNVLYMVSSVNKARTKTSKQRLKN